jgi:2,3-bisphosphoglycerate-dependent phosphoglycerate mutase
VIYLVRHGESEWNLARRTQGQIEHPHLTEAGRTQARAAARALVADLGSRSATRVVTSDLTRAVETADVIVGVLGIDVRTDARLRERSLGQLEGLPYETSFAIAAEHDWTDPDKRIAGGESRREVARRMSAALGDLDTDAVTVVVSHGDAIRTVLAGRIGCRSHQPVWFEVPNGSVAVLDHGAELRWLPVDVSVTSP